MKKRIVNISFTLLSYILLPASIYAIIFTHYGNITLLTSLILCIGILAFFVNTKLRLISKVLVMIPLLILTAFNIFNIRNLKFSDTQVEKLMVGNKERSFRYFIPPDYNTSSNKALVIALHGFKQSATGMERLTGLTELARQNNFIVIYPEGYKKSWNDGDDTKEASKENIDDISFLSAIVDWGKTYCAKKVILAGFSNGGFLAVNAGCALSDKVDIVIPVAAGTWEGNMNHCSQASKQDILFVQCKADPFTKFSRFDPSVNDYAQQTGCGLSSKIIKHGPKESWILKQYDCKDHKVMHLIVSGGGHIWPGGAQYLPSFMIGEAVKKPNLSEMIVDFFILNKQP